MKQLLRTAKRVLGSPVVIILVAFLLRFGVMYSTHAANPPLRSSTLKFGYETGAVAASSPRDRASVLPSASPLVRRPGSLPSIPICSLASSRFSASIRIVRCW